MLVGTVSQVVVDRADSGWFMTTRHGVGVPMGGAPSDGDAVRVAVVWLVAIAIWFCVAWRLFRSRPDRPAVPGTGA